jgi:hypothetical protein
MTKAGTRKRAGSGTTSDGARKSESSVSFLILWDSPDAGSNIFAICFILRASFAPFLSAGTAPILVNALDSVQKVRESLADPNALTVLLTGRGHLKFNKVLRKMCESRQLSFDLLGLKPPNDAVTGAWSLPFESSGIAKGLPEKLTYTHERKPGEPVTRFMNTLLFKQTFLEAIAKTFPGIKEMSIFEDRAGHAREFEKMGAAMVEKGLVGSFQRCVKVSITTRARSLTALSFQRPCSASDSAHADELGARVCLEDDPGVEPRSGQRKGRSSQRRRVDVDGRALGQGRLDD